MPYIDYETDVTRIGAEKSLRCLADFEAVQFDGKNALEFQQEISRTRMVINTQGALDEKLSDLVDSISPDIKFAVANTYLYLSDANNFLRERVRIPSTGQQFSTYNQTLADKRYFFFVSVAFEKLYNFWDRVGDILNASFLLGFEKVYFDKVIERLAENEMFKTNVYFMRLREFKDGSYRQYLNRLRILIVHERQKETYFRFKWVESFLENNNETVAALQLEKESFPDLLREQLSAANEGYESMIRFISECGPLER